MPRPRVPPLLIRPLLSLGFLALCAIAVFSRVDLTPQIDENFFFSSDDPQFQGTKKLEDLFHFPPQIIITAEGDIRSRPYLDRVATLTAELQQIEGVTKVLSLGAGPTSVEGALKNPLWSRLVIAHSNGDGEPQGSNFVLDLEKRPEYVRQVDAINELKERHDSPGFRVTITGGPYVVREIQKRLISDMRNFTLAAIALFSVVIFAIYRSGWILLGALTCAGTAALLNFGLLSALGLNPGPLSANLWSIVFILTLSHVVFISGNWELISRRKGSTPADPVSAAVQETGTASLWSMITNSLGFLTLLFTAAKPIRQFGLAGMLGAILALLVAYAIFPAFLRLARPPSANEGPIAGALRRRIAGPHTRITALMAVIALAATLGFNRIDTHPPVFSYFERNGKLRQDLVRIDELGGVSPLYIAVSPRNGADFLSDEVYSRLWNLQLALEQHPQVGEVLSLPLIVEQLAGSSFAPFLTWNTIYTILDLPFLGAPGAGFVTEDKKTGLFVLRMRESGLAGTPRLQIVSELQQVVRNQGFEPVVTGGLFELTGALSGLVTRSLLQGVLGLTGMLFLIALLVSRSFSMAVAVVCSLLLVPVTVLGAAGFLHLPLEIISTPGINLAMGLGVDEMIHLVHRARHSDLEAAKRALWKPIATSCLMLALGFSVFSLSHFPPTQNMGWLVVIGSAMALVVMLLVFPTVARIFVLPGKVLPQADRHRHKQRPLAGRGPTFARFRRGDSPMAETRRPPKERKYTVLSGSESADRDPVCGMTVDHSNLQLSFGDSVYYFCSKNCRDRFEANPSYFVRPLAS